MDEQIDVIDYVWRQRANSQNFQLEEGGGREEGEEGVRDWVFRFKSRGAR